MSTFHAKIRLWTIQSLGAYQDFLRTGRFRSSSEYVDPSFARAYDWMAVQLETKDPKPAVPGLRYPVWAWFQYDGLDCKNPCIRDQGLLPPGTSGVLLEILAAPDRLLMSDFQKWHAVLNEEYLPLDLIDQASFDEWLASLDDAASKRSQVRARIEASWTRIFELSAPATDCWEGIQQREIQAVLWQIEAAMVSSIEHFVAL